MVAPSDQDGAGPTAGQGEPIIWSAVGESNQPMLEEDGRPPETVPGAGATDGGEARGGTADDLAAFLDLVLYPANQPAIVETARTHGASHEIIEQLSRLPTTATFDDADQVWEALAG
jgi:hypothetical protein